MILLLILVAIVLVSSFGTVLYLRPKRASEVELSNYQIHNEVPSLFRIFDGTKIHYNQLGQGPDLVFLHGIGASTFIWRQLLPILAKNFRVTAIDMPGFGRSQKSLDFHFDLDSMADFVAKFLTDLGVEKFDLVGSSMGGSIALWIAKKNRARCSRVLTIAPATNKSLIRYPPLGLKVMKPLHFLVNKRTMFVAVANVVKRRDLLTDAMIEGYLLPFRDKGEAWQSFLKATAIVGDHRMPAELAELNSRPEFQHKIIWGDDDRVVPRRVQDELLKVLPRSEFEVLKGLGHHPFEDDPDKISLIIQNFFTRP